MVNDTIYIGLDKMNSKNTCFYLWEWFKKLICLKTMSLNKYIDVFIDEDREIFRNKEENHDNNINYAIYRDRVVLKDKPNVLIGQNISNNFFGKNLWEKAQTNIGLEFYEEGKPTKIQSKIILK